MEAVLKQLENILELLAVSQTECVRDWDLHRIQRAFQWAEYSEQLHSRFRSNPAVRDSLESALSRTLPAHPPVQLSDLAQCQHQLLTHLLRNPYAPSSLVPMLLPDPQTAARESQLDQTSLITCKSAFNLLCCTLDTTGCPGLQTEAAVRGKLLNSTITRSGDDECSRTLLDSILRDSSGGMQSLHDVIAATLLSGDDDTSAVTQHVIIAWLQDREGCFSELCESLSPGVCAALSRHSAEFKLGYWGVLKQWASCLEYDVLGCAWVLTSDGSVTFNALADRFKGLINSGGPLKEETETELKALKLQDGEFNVKGVSIWTDLMSFVLG